jgi:hypothetical protein
VAELVFHNRRAGGCRPRGLPVSRGRALELGRVVPRRQTVNSMWLHRGRAQPGRAGVSLALAGSISSSVAAGSLVAATAIVETIARAWAQSRRPRRPQSTAEADQKPAPTNQVLGSDSFQQLNRVGDRREGAHGLGDATGLASMSGIVHDRTDRAGELTYRLGSGQIEDVAGASVVRNRDAGSRAGLLVAIHGLR